MQDWYRNGIPIWIDESERITFDAVPRVSKSRAAIERAEEKASKKKGNSYGRYFTAKPRVIDGGEMPTRDEWLQQEMAKQGKNIDNRPDGPRVIQGKK